MALNYVSMLSHGTKSKDASNVVCSCRRWHSVCRKYSSVSSMLASNPHMQLCTHTIMLVCTSTCDVVHAYRRAMPSCNFHAPWFNTNSAMPHIMPLEVYQCLSERGQHLCRHIVADPGERLELGWKEGGTFKICATQNSHATIIESFYR